MAILKQPRPRARRYSFVAIVELTDLESGSHLRAETTNLSLFGCHIKTDKIWAMGTKVRIRIVYKGASFAAMAKVAYARPIFGTGIVFTDVEPIDQEILEIWVAELRNR